LFFLSLAAWHGLILSPLLSATRTTVLLKASYIQSNLAFGGVFLFGPNPRQRLLNGMRQQLLPFLEDVLEFGLGYEAGQLENTLQMTTAIVHYYPEMTQQERSWHIPLYVHNQPFMYLYKKYI